MVLQLVTSQSNDDFVTMAMSLPANQQVCHSVYLFYFFLCVLLMFIMDGTMRLNWEGLSTNTTVKPAFMPSELQSSYCSVMVHCWGVYIYTNVNAFYRFKEPTLCFLWESMEEFFYKSPKHEPMWMKLGIQVRNECTITSMEIWE